MPLQSSNEMPKSLRPYSSGHSITPRGLSAGAIDGIRHGRFDRLFPETQTTAPDDAMLLKLAEFMVTSFEADGVGAPDPGRPIIEAEVSDENATIPAAYTYFGQFVDHDLTLDVTGFGQSQKDAKAVIDFRTPALDLDCVYGGGPADQPSLYRKASNGARHLLRLGDAIAGAGPGSTRNDLLRLPALPDDPAQIALIGDKRNDENKIVSQVQATMISLHNKIYEDDDFHPGIADPDVRFENTVRLVRWHYQWVVLFDYLSGHICMSTALSDFGSLETPHLPYYAAVMAKGRDYPFMPVEFSGAAYRLGHSMVRPSYSLSAANLTKGVDGAGVPNPRFPTFGKRGDDLRGFGEPITSIWSIDWGFFIDGVTPTAPPAGAVVPQPSYRIDTRVVNPLSHLPEFEGLPPERKQEANLAYRNLNRGVGLGLPTGEEVAAALKITPLSNDQVWSAGSNRYKDEDGPSEIKSRRAAITAQGFAGHFKDRTPLWYYILREAEYYGCTRELPEAYLAGIVAAGEDPEAVKQEDLNYGGQHMGPVGSRVVLETFLGLLSYDEKSFIHQPTWRPHAKLNTGGGDFTLGKLIDYALG
ncbi:peroxidase family protein [Phenylobacterium sp.]|uniref:peroxidase family protein n=1 Tax=Phenylobacterium sp. TaxID=1871053 RepID=UPI002600BC8D|nr:peroxidase family protein [Phenylobacterium sp.]